MQKDHKKAVQPFHWLCAFLFVAIPAPGQVNVLTANYGNARTNATLNETVLNPLNVNAAQFGKLFSLPVG
jgi:hypothetical protein